MTYKNEQEVQKAMEDIVREYGGYVYKNAQSMYTPVGIPDLTACIPVHINGKLLGLFLTIEVKHNEKKYDATEAQRIVGRQIVHAGGVWLKTADPEYVRTVIEQMQAGTWE